MSVPAQAIVDELAPKLEMVLTDPPSAQICQAATALDWTRDPFDRLLCAQAIISSTAPADQGPSHPQPSFVGVVAELSRREAARSRLRCRSSLAMHSPVT